MNDLVQALADVDQKCNVCNVIQNVYNQYFKTFRVFYAK